MFRLRLRLSIEFGAPPAPRAPVVMGEPQHEHRDGFSQVERSYQPYIGFEIPGQE